MISFKEYYFLQEADGYFPTFSKIGGGLKKGMSAVGDYAKDKAKSALDLRTYSNLADRHTRAPDLFAKTRRPGGKTLADRKTLGGQQEHTRTWRDEHIIKGDALDEHIKNLLLDDRSLKAFGVEKKSEYESETEVNNADAGRVRLKNPHVVKDDATGNFKELVDGKFLDTSNKIKRFREPSHYANQILDNLQVYQAKGYSPEEIKIFTRQNFYDRLFDLIWNSYNFDSYFTKRY